jgi:hypothetical protein
LQGIDYEINFIVGDVITIDGIGCVKSMNGTEGVKIQERVGRVIGGINSGEDIKFAKGRFAVGSSGKWFRGECQQVMGRAWGSGSKFSKSTCGFGDREHGSICNSSNKGADKFATSGAAELQMFLALEPGWISEMYARLVSVSVAS